MREILIIDDDKNILGILSMLLKKFGYEVKTAVSGEEGSLILVHTV
jgi:CheY-like chemotaxis protein